MAKKKAKKKAKKTAKKKTAKKKKKQRNELAEAQACFRAWDFWQTAGNRE